MPLPPIKRPNFEHQFKMSVRDETRALISFVRFHWLSVSFVIAGVVLFFYTLRPFPPLTVSVATGQPHSTYEEIADWYEKYFAGHGVKLIRLQSDGAIENIQKLADREVDIAFSQGGIPIPPKTSIVSLGSIQYEPLWLFYRGDRFDGNDPVNFLERKKISIGAEKSGTRAFVLELIKEHKNFNQNNQNLLILNASDSVKALLDGHIDGMFLLANPESKDLEPLIANTDIHLWNFTTARAIANKIPYIKAVELPMGAFSLTPVRPTQDKELVATTTTVLANQDLHPAIQYLLMMAASNFSRSAHVYFPRPGGFPAFDDSTIPKSTIADKYIQEGASGFEHPFPFWIASFIDRMWLLVAALFAIIYPLTKMVPQYRKFHFKYDLDDRYIDLMKIETRLNETKSLDDIQEVWKAYDELEQRISETWVPSGSKERFFIFRNAMELLRLRIERTQSNIERLNF